MAPRRQQLHRGHLVLGRKPGQALVLFVGDEEIVVRVGKLVDGMVAIEVDAGQPVRIVREELLR